MIKHNHSTASLLLFALLGLNVQSFAAESATTLPTIQVNAKVENKTLAGKDEVFAKNNVTEYKSKKEIETFHSQSVGDLLSGITGVYSGDSRLGGAVDPIIRSSWGQGRIPVVVDDTEQAITIWRGFAGVSNRNYLDPFLISEINVEKGPTLTRDLRSGAAGTIRMSTLNVDDIIKPGEKWGIELKTETANNSIKKRPYPGSPIGYDYRIVSYEGWDELGEWAMYLKTNDRNIARKSGRNKFFKDNAVRLALATKDDAYEILGAYAWRNKGNYFAGKGGANKYMGQEGEDLSTMRDKLNSDDPYIPLIARIYKPGDEVPNTSYESKSWLFKTKLNFNKHTNLKINLRKSDIEYGDLMPSRLGTTFIEYKTVLEWPNANVHQKTGSIEFSYNPPDNKWLDFKIGLWGVNNYSETNTTGGSPSEVLFADNQVSWLRIDAMTEYMQDLGYDFTRAGYEEIMEKHWPVMIHKYFKPKLDEYMKDPFWKNDEGLFNTQPAHVQYARDKHWGITMSNVMDVTPKLRFSTMANYRRETLDSTNVYEIWDKWFVAANYKADGRLENCNYDRLDPESGLPSLTSLCRTGTDHHSGNRKGNRNEFNAAFKFDYAPTDWLMLSAGLKYVHYKSKDRGLQEKIANREREKTYMPNSININYKRLLKSTAEERETVKVWEARNAIIQDADRDYTKTPEAIADSERLKKIYEYDPYYESPEALAIFERGAQSIRKFINERVHNAGYTDYDYGEQTDDLSVKYNALVERLKEYNTEEHINPNYIGYWYDKNSTGTLEWKRDEYGNFRIENIPPLPESMINEKEIDPTTGKETNAWSIESLPLTNLDAIAYTQQQIATPEEWEEMKKAERKAHAWAPNYSATIFFSPNSRLYIRYDETKRMPSIFEDTIGYSIDIITPLYKRKPEHSKNLEIGYAHDLRGFFPSLRRADIRLNWYKNVTKNIYDRDINYRLVQFDKRTLEGLELQARYDQGNFFMDLGVSYNIKNKFCDKASAYFDYGIWSPHEKAYPECVNGGNENGYLKNTILPKYSITSNIGVRLFDDESLELGTRWVYHTNVKETRNKSLRDAGFWANNNNNPRWQPVLIVDAYANYRVNDNLSATLSVNNLTDRYYLDPMTRSSMPAPGRTIKFGLTASF